MNPLWQRLRKDFTPQLGTLGAGVLRALHATLRVEQRGVLPEGPVIVAFWHGEQQVVLPARDRALGILTSMSDDGAIQAEILNRLGCEAIRGSSSRGARLGLLNLVRRVRSGGSVALAVDGPRGPRCVVKPGVIELAKLSRRPIVGVRGHASARWCFESSWDHFQLPKPGARVEITFLEPMEVPAETRRSELEQYRCHLEASMNQELSS